MDVRDLMGEAASQAVGRTHRTDEVTPRTGGPAGNARLTAWTGLTLLLLFGAEMVTLLDVRGLVSWHVVIGVLLIPPALVKTGSTGWRMVRYYAGSPMYRRAGPPPMLLRLLGPVVVVTTLAVLGTGLALILVSPDAARSPFAAGVSLLMLHKGSFVLWFGATAVHTLGRLVPAFGLVTGGGLPGRAARALTLGLTLAVAVLAAVLALSVAGPWRQNPGFEGRPDQIHDVHR